MSDNETLNNRGGGYNVDIDSDCTLEPDNDCIWMKFMLQEYNGINPNFFNLSGCSTYSEFFDYLLNGNDKFGSGVEYFMSFRRNSNSHYVSPPFRLLHH